MTALRVYLHEDRAGELQRLKGAQLRFTYDTEWVAGAGPALSCALPVRPEPYDDGECRPFFAGLLPEGDFGKAIARVFHIAADNAFDLLEAIGGDCAGAVSLVPPGGAPPHATARQPKWLSEAELSDLLERLPERPLLAGEQDGVRLSLAGTQDKLPVLCGDGRIAITAGEPPSTHIIKTPIRRLKDTVANEAFCLELAAGAGLDVARAAPRVAGGHEYLLVDRYDRQANGTVARLHQEDLCQALGYLPAEKYENAGGPGIATCVSLLRRHCAAPAVDLLAFFDAVIFNMLIGNQDAHSKNYSLLLEGPAAPQLAPLYDLISTRVYPDLSKKLAMKFGEEYRPSYIRGRHLERLAQDFGMAVPAARDRAAQLADRVTAATAKAQHELLAPWKDSPVIDRVVGIVENNAKTIQRAAKELRG
jgi:serine/threonine-protein kinase HipA